MFKNGMEKQLQSKQKRQVGEAAAGLSPWLHFKTTSMSFFNVLRHEMTASLRLVCEVELTGYRFLNHS